MPFFLYVVGFSIALSLKSKKKGGIRKHKGIIQYGGNKGRLKKGYKYSGKKLKNGKAEIIKVKKIKKIKKN